LFTLRGHSLAASGVSFSPDGTRLASASADNTLVVWDFVRRRMTVCEGHGAQVTGVAFSPDGKRLVSGSLDETVKLWDAATGVEVKSLSGHAGGVSGVAYAADGKTVASASWDGTVKLWDAAVSPDVQEELDARAAVDALFEQLLLKEEVLER